jgi:hypothetical protein
MWSGVPSTGRHEGVSIFCGIGERCRGGEELYREMKEVGVLPNMVMVFGQMNEPPGIRFRVGHAALTMAEYFRDDEHRDVLLLDLKILLSFRIFEAKGGVSRIVAETREGSFGLLPHRLDCVAALTPGILTYETEQDGEIFVYEQSMGALADYDRTVELGLSACLREGGAGAFMFGGEAGESPRDVPPRASGQHRRGTLRRAFWFRSAVGGDSQDESASEYYA